MTESLQQARGDTPPLLLLLNASADIDALVRSGERQVLRWAEREVSGECFAGDLADPATYQCAAEARAVTAVIDLPDHASATAALEALRAVRPDAAVLVLSDGRDEQPGDGTLVRAGSLRDVLRLDLEEELQRLEAERRAFCLQMFADGAAVVPILIHPDPDPDALSSAYAVRGLLQRTPDQSPLVTLGAIRRPENRRMAELLKLRVIEITVAELQAFERVITVDMQPTGLAAEGKPRFAVIDHHPAERDYRAEFLDLRPEYGATASMVTEYLRATGERPITSLMATALLHGIRTDTDSLSRGVSPADVQAYALLQSHADLTLLRRIEKPAYPLELARTYGNALANVRSVDGIVLAHTGELEEEESHLLPEIADFCLDVETATVAVATGFINGDLVFTLRHAGRAERDAGELARAIAADGGKGGGHATMARASLPRELVRERFGEEAGELPDRLLAYIRELAWSEEGEPALSRRS